MYETIVNHQRKSSRTSDFNLSNLFFVLVGCKMGNNVRINSFRINDPYLLTLEDGVVIGGEAVISCHSNERGVLILQEIFIGENSVIGAHSYIAPGVEIGKNCTIGLGCYIRPGKKIPDNSILTIVGNVSMSTANKIEKSRI